MKNLRLFTAILFVAVFAGAAFPYSGEPDPTFGNGGFVELYNPANLPTYSAWYRGVRVLPDGKLLFFGTSTNTSSGANTVIVRRTHPNGTTDTSYGSMGYAFHDIVTPFQPVIPISGSASDMVLQSDGSVLVAGSVDVSGVTRPAIWKILPSGANDKTFGTNGRVLLSASTGGAASIDVYQTRLLVVYTVANTSYLVKRLASGAADTSFGTNGSVTLTTSSSDTHSSQVKVIQSTGKMFTTDGGLRRRNTNGSIDTTFPTPFGSPRVPDVSHCTGQANSTYAINRIKIQSDGKLLVAGTTAYWNANPGAYNFSSVVTRYRTSGAIDDTFNSGEFVCRGSTFFYNFTIPNEQLDGKIVVSSQSQVGGVNFGRLNSDGSTDTSYTGSTITPAVEDVVIDAHGNSIVVHRHGAWRFYD